MVDRVRYESKGHHGMYVGFVKRVMDSKFAGRLQVWIPELRSDEDDPDGWIICNYCTPFGGVTNWQSISENIYDTHEKTQTSYGFWAVPPDINNEVVVLFLNGDISRAVWIGSLYGEFMNNMVPESPHSAGNKNLRGTELPTVEYNKYDRRSGDASDPINAIRPWNKFKSKGIGNKGLIRDKIRGLSSSSSMRESPSKVFGFSTPGQLIKGENGTRKGGHALIMDDSEDNEHISLVTSSGSKVRIDDTNGLIYIINRDGNAWIQMDEDGNVDVFSGGDISYRAKGNMNFRSDKNINIEAGNSINIKAAADSDSSGDYVGEGSGTGGEINIEVLTSYNAYVHGDINVTSKSGDLSVDMANGNIYTTVSGDINETATGGVLRKADTFNITASNGIKASAKTIDLSTSGQLTMSNGTISIAAGPFMVDPSGNISASAVSAASIAASGPVSSGSMTMDDFLDHKHDFIDANGSPKVTQAPTNSPSPIPVTPPSPSSAQGTDSPASGTSASVIATVTKVDVLKEYPRTKVTEYDGSSLDIPDWWNRETLEITTIVDRLMTYEPCPEHKRKGE